MKLPVFLKEFFSAASDIFAFWKVALAPWVES